MEGKGQTQESPTLGTDPVPVLQPAKPIQETCYCVQRTEDVEGLSGCTSKHNEESQEHSSSCQEQSNATTTEESDSNEDEEIVTLSNGEEEKLVSIQPRKPKSKPVVTSPHERKPKLRTSKDVFDRLKWDFNSILVKTSNEGIEEEPVDLSSVYVGYKDRFLGMCELRFEDFEPGGDIPFHRVYYFRTGGPPVEPFIGKDGEVKVRDDNLPPGTVFIWDRDSRTDLIFKSGNSSISKR